MLDAILGSQRSRRRCRVLFRLLGHLHGILVLAVDNVDPVSMPKRPVGHVPPKNPQLADGSNSFWSRFWSSFLLLLFSVLHPPPTMLLADLTLHRTGCAK